MRKAGPQEEKTKKVSKKVVLPILAVFVIAAGIGIYMLANSKEKPTAKVTDPCYFFTLDNAKTLLGDKTEKGGVAPVTQTTSENININTCSYSQGIANVRKTNTKSKSTSVLVRSPQTDAGKQYNLYGFNEGKPKTVKDVPGYGQKAFWDPRLGVLNVLKGDKWIILSYGVANSASARTLDEAKKLADIVVPKL